MNSRLVAALFACSLIAPAGAHAETVNPQPEAQILERRDPALAGIRAAVTLYFRGHATGDPSHLRQAFLPTARIEGVRDSKLTSWTVDEYCALFKGVPASDEADRVRTIDIMDVSGDAGMAKATLQHGATIFTDYFILLRVGDDWKIANKVYSGRKSDNAAR